MTFGRRGTGTSELRRGALLRARDGGFSRGDLVAWSGPCCAGGGFARAEFGIPDYN